VFADPGISDELAEKVVAFVDREAGRDAPLTPDDEAMVRELLKSDPAVQKLAEDLRATNAGLDTLLDDVATVQVPAHLEALIRGHAAQDILIPDRQQQDGTAASSEGRGDGVGWRQSSPPGFGYGAVAAAASIAFFISCGVLLHFYTAFQESRSRLEAELAAASDASQTVEQDLAAASEELQRLTGLVEEASNERLQTTRQLTENEDRIGRFEIEIASLQDRYEALVGENERLSRLADTRTAEIADVEAARDQVAVELADAQRALETGRAQGDGTRQRLRAQIDGLSEELADRQKLLAELSEELESTLQQSAEATTDLADARSEQEATRRRLAAMEADTQELIAERDATEQALVDAESREAVLAARIEDAEARIRTVAAGITAAEGARLDAQQQIFGLQAELAASKSWLGQIAQYHRVYASTARRHLVEVGADEQEHIEQWLGKMLKRPVPVPDLSDYGVTFAGARLLGINEKPVAQLVYLDAEDQPLALCIIPSTKEVKGATLSNNQDLNLVDWRDGRHGYALVGWSDAELLALLASAIQPVYDL
jgi:anti-sigma factor RsiW